MLSREYKNISVDTCDHENTFIGLELYTEKINVDLMESDEDIFSCKITSKIPQLLNKLILILPGHWGKSVKHKLKLYENNS
jgi:hypothetical protein